MPTALSVITTQSRPGPVGPTIQPDFPSVRTFATADVSSGKGSVFFPEFPGTAAPGRNGPFLIVANDREFSDDLAQCLSGIGCDVCAVQTATATLACLSTRLWRAIVLDATPSAFDALKLLRCIRQTSAVPILLVGSANDGTEEIAGLEAGADCYLAKSNSHRQIFARLQAVTRRMAANQEHELSIFRPVRKIAVADLHIHPAKRRVSLAGRRVTLTPSEFDILLALAKAKGKVKTRDQLWAEIRAREYEVYERALDVQVCTLRKKLGERPRNPRFIQTVRSRGYMLVNPDPSPSE